jgi:hypothetical protein
MPIGKVGAYCDLPYSVHGWDLNQIIPGYFIAELYTLASRKCPALVALILASMAKVMFLN